LTLGCGIPIKAVWRRERTALAPTVECPIINGLADSKKVMHPKFMVKGESNVE